MSELKPCPFCGNEIELFSSHFEGQWCVHPPVIHCTACHQDYEGVGIAICDAMSDAKKEDFADNLLRNWWNHRPAEDALTAEVERLKGVIAEISAMTLTGADDVEDFIFMLCKDTVSDGAIKKAYREHLKKQIANMIDFGKDTDVLTKESEGEDE